MTIKEPLGTWLLVVLGVVVTILGQGYNAPWRDQMLLVAPGSAILIFVSSQAGFSVHSRYVIPALPFLFIWASKVARAFEMRPSAIEHAAIATMVVVALAWSVASSLWAFPHSLSYFNELVGGPMHGGEYLLDSNMDWGQDLLYLKDWLDTHPDNKLDGLACWTSYPLVLAGLPDKPHPPLGLDADGAQRNHDDSSADLGPRPGWYALSLNYLYSRDCRYRYFLTFEPVATAGYSIYIYHITPHEANRVRRKLGLTELGSNRAHVIP